MLIRYNHIQFYYKYRGILHYNYMQLKESADDGQLVGYLQFLRPTILDFWEIGESARPIHIIDPSTSFPTI